MWLLDSIVLSVALEIVFLPKRLQIPSDSQSVYDPDSVGDADLTDSLEGGYIPSTDVMPDIRVVSLEEISDITVVGERSRATLVVLVREAVDLRCIEIVALNVEDDPFDFLHGLSRFIPFSLINFSLSYSLSYYVFPVLSTPIENFMKNFPWR